MVVTDRFHCIYRTFANMDWFCSHWGLGWNSNFIPPFWNGNDRSPFIFRKYSKLITYLLLKPIHISEFTMENFYILGSNLSFPTSLPSGMTGNGYHLCGRYSGRPPAGALSKVTCQPLPVTARFVYIQVDRSASPTLLELCEVWVYAGKLIDKMNTRVTFL